MNYPARLNDGYYHVRTDEAQIGQYKLLSSAVKKADDNPGACVYDDAGNQVYPEMKEVEEAVAEEAEQKKPKEGTDPVMYARLNRLMNIRSGPSYTATILCTKPKGTLLEVVCEIDGWYKLADGTYISADPALVTTGLDTYTVQAGDSLQTIAQAHNTTEDKIKSMNGVSTVHPGMVLLMEGLINDD